MGKAVSNDGLACVNVIRNLEITCFDSHSEIRAVPSDHGRKQLMLALASFTLTLLNFQHILSLKKVLSQEQCQLHKKTYIIFIYLISSHMRSVVAQSLLSCGCLAPPHYEQLRTLPRLSVPLQPKGKVLLPLILTLLDATV